MAHPSSASESFHDSSSSDTASGQLSEGAVLAPLIDLLSTIDAIADPEAEISTVDPADCANSGSSGSSPNPNHPQADPPHPAASADRREAGNGRSSRSSDTAAASVDLLAEVFGVADGLLGLDESSDSSEPGESSDLSGSEAAASIADAAEPIAEPEIVEPEMADDVVDAEAIEVEAIAPVVLPDDPKGAPSSSPAPQGDREPNVPLARNPERDRRGDRAADPDQDLEASTVSGDAPRAIDTPNPDPAPASPQPAPLPHRPRAKSPAPQASASRVKLSPKTLRERVTVGEFVEPIASARPTNHPPAPSPPSSPQPPASPAPRPARRSRSTLSTPSNPTPSYDLVPAERARIVALERRLLALESQLNSEALVEERDKQKKVQPLLDEILSSLTPTALRQETIKSIIPVIDRIIIERAEQNHMAMSAALADLMPQAIARQIEADPHTIAEAIAPEMAEAIRRQIALKRGVLADAISSEMGEAIRRQIQLEHAEMVDALYPVIGNTITKYMSEEIRNINAKVEQSFSFEGLTRKVRSKLQGVSEAELILRDAASFSVKAAFLIQKDSGLVIAEAQQPQASQLESDMIGGMLTAIRSFANDCIAQADAGRSAELNEIEYDTFKLVLEVAGYCYVALVVKGSITKSYVNHMRLVMVKLVQQYGSIIKNFDGDPATVPDKIPTAIASLVPDPVDISEQQAKEAKHPPLLLVLLVLGLLGGVMLWARQVWLDRVEQTVLRKIDTIPELTSYQIQVEAKGRQLELSGDLPSRSLQERLLAIVTPLVPDREVVDRTQLAVFEPDEVTIAADVDRLTALLNRTLPATVVSEYQNRRIILKGWAEDEAVLAAIGQAFEAIPGVRSVSSALLINAPPDRIRLYFELGQVNPIAIGEGKLDSVRRYLNDFPTVKLAVIGHADRLGSEEQNRVLAKARAERVRQLLVDRGVAADRLTVSGSPDLPPGISPQQALELSRCVRFEIRQSLTP